MLRNKKVIYTFLTGDYDNLEDPKIISADWDYLCFTDNPDIKSDVWKIIPIPEEYNDITDPKKKAMLQMIEYYKIIDEFYDVVISISTDLVPQCHLDKYLNEIDFSNYEIVALKHPSRNCVYQEAQAVIQGNLDFPQIVNFQMNRYHQDNYPKNNGLWASAVIVRNNKSENVRKACMIWSEEYRNGSRRDQLSWNYSFWKSEKLDFPVKVGVYSDWEKAVHGLFTIKPHKNGMLSKIRCIAKPTS